VPYVEDLSGQLERRCAELTEQPMFIGRDPSVCELCFPDHVVAVSRIHASVRWDSATHHAILRDEGSMNGTFLRGAWKRLVEGEDTPIDVGQGFFLAQAGLALRIVK
jgi:pSer/pThr/pTyr-binding forkhead associated (FHA) protein